MSGDAKKAGVKPAGALVEAIVTRGHTVQAGGIYNGPGKTVALPADEIDRLRAAGFVMLEDEIPPAPVRVIGQPTVVRPGR